MAPSVLRLLNCLEKDRLGISHEALQRCFRRILQTRLSPSLRRAHTFSKKEQETAESN